MASNSGNPRSRKPKALRALNIHPLGFMAKNAALGSARSTLMLAYPLDFDAPLDGECNTPFEESWQGERFKVICVESTWPSRLPRFVSSQWLLFYFSVSIQREIGVRSQQNALQSMHLHVVPQSVR